LRHGGPILAFSQFSFVNVSGARLGGAPPGGASGSRPALCGAPWLASRQQAMMIALLGLPLGLLLQPRLAHRHARRADVRMGTETSTAYGAEQVRARLQRIPACPIVAWKL
jgi:hypothetical protein